ncbi:O-antigen ligase family protein [candidate division KSB1 bacterium]
MEKMKIDKLSAFGIYFFAAVAPFSNAGMEIGIGFLFLIWIFKIVLERKVLFHFDIITKFILAYFLVMVVSGLFSERPVRSALMIKEEWIVLVYFAIVNLLPSRKVFHRALTVLAVSCSLVGLYAVWQHFYGIDLIRLVEFPNYGGYFRSGGCFGFCLTFGGFYIIAYIVSLGCFLGAREMKDKILYLSSSIIIFLAVIASYTRSSWLGAAAGSVLFAVAHNWKTGLKYIAVFLLFWAGIYLFHPTLFTEYGVTSITDPNYSEGSQMRMDLWKKGFEMWKDNPVLGLGQGNFSYFHEKYNFEEHIFGFAHLHNEYLNVAVQTGILGLLAFLGIWIFYIFSCLKFWVKEKEIDFKTASAVLGCAGAISGILAAGMFQCFYTDIEVGMFWWFIAGLSSGVIALGQKDAPEDQMTL